METQNIYRNIWKQLQENFCEEAAPFLTEKQIREILAQEKTKIEFSEQNHIPLPSWMGNNLRRYCKDLLRRQQPLFTLYYLLGVCTEAGIALFLCYGIYSLLCTGFPGLSFCAIPGLLLVWFCGQEWNHSYARRQITHNHVPKMVHKLFHFLIPAPIVSLGSVLLWDKLLPLYRAMNIQNTFLLCAVLLFLSGIHNVLYSSHMISFLSVGFLCCGRHQEAEIQEMVSRYLDRRSLDILTERNKTKAEMEADPKLYADVLMSIRSHVVTYRIYLLFAVLILTAFDILCIYQNLHSHSISMAILGSVTILAIVLLMVCIISCNKIIRRLSDK